MKLSVPQRALLHDLAEAQYGSLTLGSNYLRTARSLKKLGLVEPVGYGMRSYGLTDTGRKAVEEDA